LNPGLRGGKPATNRLSYGTALPAKIGTEQFRDKCLVFFFLLDQQVRYEDDDNAAIVWWSEDVDTFANISEEFTAYIFKTED
jgi:hypothetical protein